MKQTFADLWGWILDAFPFWHVVAVIVLIASCITSSGCGEGSWGLQFHSSEAGQDQGPQISPDQDEQNPPDERPEFRPAPDFPRPREQPQYDPYGPRGTPAPGQSAPAETDGWHPSTGNIPEPSQPAAIPAPAVRETIVVPQATTNVSQFAPVFPPVTAINSRQLCSAAAGVSGTRPHWTGACVICSGGCGAGRQLRRDLRSCSAWSSDWDRWDVDFRFVETNDSNIACPTIVFYEDGEENSRIEGYDGTRRELETILARHPRNHDRSDSFVGSSYQPQSYAPGPYAPQYQPAPSYCPPQCGAPCGQSYPLFSAGVGCGPVQIGTSCRVGY